MTRARELLEASDRAAARRELTEALKLYPGNPAVHNFLGVVEAGEGNYRAAEGHFREAVRRAPDYTDAHLNLGRLYQEHGEGDPQAAKKALAAYQAVLRHDPAHAEARFQTRTTRPPARCSRRPRSGPRPPPRPTTSWPGSPARRTSSRRR